jgi:hypothetical protein
MNESIRSRVITLGQADHSNSVTQEVPVGCYRNVIEELVGC